MGTSNTVDVVFRAMWGEPGSALSATAEAAEAFIKYDTVTEEPEYGEAERRLYEAWDVFTDGESFGAHPTFGNNNGVRRRMGRPEHLAYVQAQVDYAKQASEDLFGETRVEFSVTETHSTVRLWTEESAEPSELTVRGFLEPLLTIAFLSGVRHALETFPAVDSDEMAASLANFRPTRRLNDGTF